MRVFKSTYTDQKTGRQRETSGFYVEFRDHLEQVRRMPALSTRAQSEEFGRKIDQLVARRVSGSSPDLALARWIESLSPKVRRRLLRFGLLDAGQVAAGKPLAEQVDDFETWLRTKGNTLHHVKLAAGRVRKVVKGCGFTNWSEILASQVQKYLAGLREGEEKISAQTYNHYLVTLKSFCRWMVRDRRATESPLEHLQGLNVRTDRRHDRRALSVEEMIWLLDTTSKGPERGSVPGPDRAVLYRVAAETGLRAGELRSLTVGAFSLETKPPTVTVAAAYSKHRRDDVVVLKNETAALLRTLFAGKMPAAAAFRMPAKSMLPLVLKRDLEAARTRWLSTTKDANLRGEIEKTDFLMYQDHAKRYADFHAFRHATGSFLAAYGASPRVAQAILRHSDYKLTMNIYTHAFRADEAEAVQRLPDLSRTPVGGTESKIG